MSTPSISRIPRYQLHQTRARKASSTEKTNPNTPKEAEPLRTNSESALSSLVSAPGDVKPRAASPAYSAGKSVRSYSDALMARMPPMPGALGETPARVTSGVTEATAPQAGRDESATVDTSVSRDTLSKERTTTFETPDDHASLSEDSGDDQNGLWTTVHKKRASRANTHDLTQEQENLVRKAETTLTAAEKERIKARRDIPSQPASDGSETEDSAEEGPSNRELGEPRSR
jgi:hypothetical protein